MATAGTQDRATRVDQVLTLLRLVGEAQEVNSLAMSLRSVAEMAALLADAGVAGVFVADDTSGVLRLAASYGLDKEAEKSGLMSLRNVSWARARQSRFVSRDPAEGQPTEGLDELPAAFQGASYWVPLVQTGETIGSLAVAGLRRGAPDRTALEFLRLIAIYATTLISTVRLHTALSHRVTALTTLAEVAQALSSTLDLDRVLRLIVDSVSRLSEAQSCSIMLLDPNRQELTIRMSIGIPEEVVKSAVRKLGEGISGRVAATGEPIFLHDVADAAQGGLAGCNPGRYRNPSLISVPLKARGQVIGVLNANDKKSGDFTEEDFSLVSLFANQAAVAIDNARAHDQLWKTSVTDGLTQTYVHTYFQERLTEMARTAVNTGGRLAVVMVDIDHFKNVNDRYGHPVGDAVLQGTAALLRHAVRAHDVVARYGGEEFVLVLSEVSPRIAVGVAERLRRGIEAASFPAGTEKVQVTASFGLSMLPVDGTDPLALVQLADKHLYASKRGGRNRVTCSRTLMEMALAEPPPAQSSR
ncbi:MAG: diguanylate cyclase [Deltaproteobacteria bacterium]|nr:diguanylate cyclase [Deltaproteobacteria bacterium]